jgi:large subunit ribosomal protein L18
MPSYGSRYRVPLRRRREKKTDYQARKGFVVSGRPRLVARSSLKNTIAQIIVAKPHGDLVLASAHSKELAKAYGWKAASGNVPAAYLTGLLCGLKARKNGVAEAILDLGLVSPTKGSKVFATLSGAVDAGVTIPHSAEKIVKDRVRGDHIQEYAESLGASSEYAPKFSSYLAKGISPEKFIDHFVEVRNSILTAFGMPIPKTEPKPVKMRKPEPKPVKIEKSEAKKVEAKIAKTERAEQKPEVAAPKVVESKKPKAVEVEPEQKTEAKPRIEMEEKPKIEEQAKPAAKSGAKSAVKKAKPVKAEEEEVAAASEAKPKRARKKAETKESGSVAGPKPAKKTGGKKE